VRTSRWANSGSFSASANSTAEATDSSIVEIIGEMNRMRTEKVTQEELEGYKNYMAGTFALGLENPRTLARYAINIAKNNLPSDYYKNYLKNIDKVTADDVMRVSKKYIKPGVAHITVAGDKTSNIEKLKKFGPVTVYDVYGNEVKDAPSKALPTGITARDIIKKYIANTGGMDKWKAIKDIKTTMEMTGAAPFPLKITSIKKEGSKLFEEVSSESMGTLQKTVFNGKTGKSSGMQGSKNIEGDAVAENQKKAIIFDEEQYLDDSHKLKLVGTEKVEGEDCYVVAVTDATNKTSTEFYSMKTGLRVQSVSTMEAQGKKMTMTTKIGDYKEVGGLKFPHSINQSVGPQNMKITVKSIEVNKGVDDKTFEAE
jgi:outer membrane lipoprotein-sorting protein